MTISQLIAALEKIRAEHGDISVMTFDDEMNGVDHYDDPFVSLEPMMPLRFNFREATDDEIGADDPRIRQAVLLI